MTTERVSVIIPNWNGSAILAGCLESLRLQSFDQFVTYVIDNGSVDDSVAMVSARFPEVRVIAQTVNVGFCTAMNSGIAESRGEYIVALNNDTEVHPAWLAELVAAMDANPAISFATSKILDFRDRTIIDTVGDGYAFWGVSYKIGSRHVDTNRFREPFEVFGASGAASIYRREMLDTIGCFDPDFFAYMEDVDLSVRARLAGYRCLSVPDAIVYHMGAATTGGTTSAFSVRLTVRNGIGLIVKNMPLPLLPVVLASALVAQGGAVALSLFTTRLPWLRQNLPAYRQGLFEALKEMPASWRKRRAVSRLQRVSWLEFWRLMSMSIKMCRDFPSTPPRGEV